MILDDFGVEGKKYFDDLGDDKILFSVGFGFMQKLFSAGFGVDEKLFLDDLGVDEKLFWEGQREFFDAGKRVFAAILPPGKLFSQKACIFVSSVLIFYLVRLLWKKRTSERIFSE